MSFFIDTPTTLTDLGPIESPVFAPGTTMLRYFTSFLFAPFLLTVTLHGADLTPPVAPTTEDIHHASQWTRAVIHTPRGAIAVTLFPATAPHTVANFVKLARSGFYDGTTFHRVVPGFVIQGGDPNTRPGGPGGMPGTGGPGYTIPAEVGPGNPEKHLPGTLAMARSAALDSAGSQFYLTCATIPHLDGGYTVFGRITNPQDLAIINAVRMGDPLRVEIPAAPATP